MSKPTQRHTKARTARRRSHHALTPLQVVFDQDGNPSLPHRANPFTGRYKGRQVVDKEARIRRARRNMGA